MHPQKLPNFPCLIVIPIPHSGHFGALILSLVQEEHTGMPSLFVFVAVFPHLAHLVVIENKKIESYLT